MPDLAAIENAHMVTTNDGGRTPVPELEPSWPNLLKLKWHAALVRAETGIDVQVREAKYWINDVFQPGYYSIQMRYNTTEGHVSSSSGPHAYRDAWTYLNGIRAGAQAVAQ